MSVVLTTTLSETASYSEGQTPKLAPKRSIPPSNLGKSVLSGSDPRPLLVVDTLNVIRADHFHPRLEVFLAVMWDALGRYDVAAICDAVTRYRIDDYQGAAHVRAYLHLLEHFTYHIAETTGGIEADTVILSVAEEHDAKILSNDQFRDRLRDYPWVAEEYRVLKLTVFRDVVYIGNRRIHVETDLDAAMAKLEDRLKNTPIR